MKSKSLVLLTLAALTLVHTPSFAAKKNAPMSEREISNIDRRQSISIYPLGFLIGRFGAVYSIQVSDYIALSPGISASYLSAGSFGSSFSIFSIGPSIGARFFLSDTAFNSGWFVEPTVAFSYTSVGANSGSNLSGFSFGTQAVAGYAWYWDSGFTLGLAGGLGYSLYSGNIQGLGSNALSGWALYPHPVVDFSLGYSW